MKKKIIFINIVILILVGCASKKLIFDENNKGEILQISKTTETKKPIQLKQTKQKLKGIYKEDKEVKKFIKSMVKNHNFKYNDLIHIFSLVEFQQKALDKILGKKRVKKPLTAKIKKPKKKRIRYGSWDRYRKIFISQKRVGMGVDYWLKHKDYLDKAYEVYGVPPEYILGILGVETIFGNYLGDYPVFDTLSTLTFSPNRRSKFFRNELEKFLIMVKDEKLDIDKIVGSYAGAIGLGQFMPSNYKIFAVDFNEDGVVDLWNPEDAIGSVANYFKKHNWKKDKMVTVRAKYKGTRFRKLKTGYKKTYSQKWLKRRHKITPREKLKDSKRVRLIKLSKGNFDELWMSSRNFYVITRYNHSAYYAMVVHQLGQEIKDEYLRQKK